MLAARRRTPTAKTPERMNLLLIIDAFLEIRAFFSLL